MDLAIIEAAAEALTEPVRSVRKVDEGWDFDVSQLNDRWIVRVPRRPEAAAALEREVVLLPTLDQALPVDVPRLRHVLRVPQLAVVYPMIVGRRLKDELERGADHEVLGEDLGRFLAALHALPVSRARALGVVEHGPAEVSSFVQRCIDEIFPLLEPFERTFARCVFDSYLTGPAPPAALHHADLGTSHVLCDAGRVTGVIDWTDARIGDPALDLWWLARDWSSSFVQGIAGGYERAGHVIDDAVLRRAGFWYFAGPWHEVLYGLGPGEDTFVASGLAGIRSRLP